MIKLAIPFHYIKKLLPFKLISLCITVPICTSSSTMRFCKYMKKEPTVGYLMGRGVWL